MDMPTLTQLNYIVALHRAGHFGKAAAECHVSQPTLSVQIAKAEAELGFALFDRRAKPIMATDHGLRFIAMAREVLQANARMLAAAGRTRTLSGPFHLGVIPTLAPYVLPWLVGPFAQRCPDVQLTVLERTTSNIVDEITAMRMDAALLATPLGEATLQRTVLFYDPFYLFAHRSSALLESGDVDIATINRGDLWLLEDGHCFRNQVVHLCGLHTRTLLPSVRFEAGSFDTLRGLIDSTGGVTLFPESYVRTLPAVVQRSQVRAFQDRIPTREVSLVTHRAHWKTDIVEIIADIIRQHAPRSLPRELGKGEVLPVLS